MTDGTWTYRLEYVRCGKANCQTCAGGPAHGPYCFEWMVSAAPQVEFLVPGDVLTHINGPKILRVKHFRLPQHG